MSADPLKYSNIYHFPTVEKRFCFLRFSLVLLLWLSHQLKIFFSFVYMNCFYDFYPSQMACDFSRTFMIKCKWQTREQTKQHCCTQVMVQISKHDQGDFWVVKLFTPWLLLLLALCAPAEALLHYECKGRSAAYPSLHTENLRRCHLFTWQWKQREFTFRAMNSCMSS